MIGRCRRPPTGSGRPTRARSVLSLPALLVAALLVAAAGCGSDEEPEPTFEERLAQLEGQALTPAEVAGRVEVGETLCRLDESVLDHIWLQLDEDQLAFQDLVFSMLCPDRAIEYAGHTGRYVTEEAEQSGVVTSTTRPASTTSTTRPTTTRATSAGPPFGLDTGTGTTDPTTDTSITATTSTTTTTTATTTTTTATTTASITGSTTGLATSTVLTTTGT